MPGAYAHITAVGKAQENLKDLGWFPVEVRKILRANLPFCMLGSLGPDYPYLDKVHLDDKQWADTMHYERVRDRVLEGIAALRLFPVLDRELALAWLLGFTAHVVADVTIHPVVELKVGPYKGNETEHRICEINQDVHIFDTKAGVAFQSAEFLKAVAEQASDPAHPDQLHRVVRRFWETMFEKADTELLARNSIHPDSWHSWFRNLVAGVADEQLVAMARHVVPWLQSLTYPKPEHVKREFIDRLEVPGGGYMSYDEVFAKAVLNIQQAWAAVGKSALLGTNDADSFLKNWNLDTGRDENGIQTFWS